MTPRAGLWPSHKDDFLFHILNVYMGGGSRVRDVSVCTRRSEDKFSLAFFRLYPLLLIFNFEEGSLSSLKTHQSGQAG